MTLTKFLGTVGIWTMILGGIDAQTQERENIKSKIEIIYPEGGTLEKTYLSSNSNKTTTFKIKDLPGQDYFSSQTIKPDKTTSFEKANLLLPTVKINYKNSDIYLLFVNPNPNRESQGVPTDNLFNPMYVEARLFGFPKEEGKWTGQFPSMIIAIPGINTKGEIFENYKKAVEFYLSDQPEKSKEIMKPFLDWYMKYIDLDKFLESNKGLFD